MTYSNRLKTTLRTFVFLCLGCFMLLACSTINTTYKPVIENDKSNSSVVRLPESTKEPGTTYNKNELSPEGKTVEAEPPLKGKGSLANAEISSQKEESVKAEHLLSVKTNIADAELFTEDNEIEGSSLTDTDAVSSEDAKAEKSEKEKDVMEETLFLLDESKEQWTKGEFDNAMELLDQAYVLLVETNGNPEIARQKDDLRLIIAKRILTIYNSSQSPTKGMRSEIPLILNAAVEREIRSFQTIERDYFISSYQRSMIYRPAISAELKKAGLPDELSWLPLVESGFKINALSSARALGLWQFIPSTGYKYNLNRDYWIDERLDFEKSTIAAIAYLTELHSMFGDWLTALAGYNCGEGRIARTIASQHINYLDNFWDLYQRLPNETARYVPRFLATLHIVKNPQKYGFDLATEQNQFILSDYETVETNRSINLHDVAVKLETSEKRLCLLNAELRYKITPDKSYKLKVPQGKKEKLLQVVAEISPAKIPHISYKTVRRAFIKHRVRNGETLGGIAKKYHASVNAIRSANRLAKRRAIYPRQILKIPVNQKVYANAKNRVRAKKGSLYKVRKGESLSVIADKYGVSARKLKNINNLKSESIQAGQVLRIKTGGR